MRGSRLIGARCCCQSLLLHANLFTTTSAARFSAPARSLPSPTPPAPPAPSLTSIIDAQIAEHKAKAAFLEKLRADQDLEAGMIVRRYTPRPASPPPRTYLGPPRDEYSPHRPSPIIRVPFPPAPPAAPPPPPPPPPPFSRPPPLPNQQRRDYVDRYRPTDRY